MKNILRLGILTAIALTIGAPAWSAPSDKDMGFSGGGGGAGGGVGGQSAGATGSNGADITGFKTDNRSFGGDQIQQLNDVWDKPAGSGETNKTNTTNYQQILSDVETSTQLLAPLSVSGKSFKDRFKLGFPSPKGPSAFGSNWLGLPATGTGAPKVDVTNGYF